MNNPTCAQCDCVAGCQANPKACPNVSVKPAKPVAWWIPKAEQFCLQDKDDSRPFAKAWEPLYTAPTTAQPKDKP